VAGTERHADADLVRVPRHGVRNDAVDTDGHEQQTDGREYTKKRQTEARLRVGKLFQEVVD
jgi:hypothetical protein